MCGIVGAVAQRNVTNILIECLRLLEYRGYDSSGIATCNNNILQCARTVGAVEKLANMLKEKPLIGNIGIAHTRWATHGQPTENNAHPHVSNATVAVVHNGIIENHEALCAKLTAKNYKFTTETDTEVIAHSIHSYCAEGHDFLTATYKTTQELVGSFSLVIMHKDYPDQMIAVRSGSPLVLGLGIDENFVASDSVALLPVTRQMIYLEEGDIAVINHDRVVIYDANLQVITRPTKLSDLTPDAASRGNYRHFMQKEIFEQPSAIAYTMESRLNTNNIFTEAFGNNAKNILGKVKRVQIIACGSSYHAGLVGKYWLESLINIPCKVEVASEFRYRKVAVEPDTLLLTISQSGETADTLGALRHAKTQNYLGSLTICNVSESSLVRESDLVFMTRAGIEVGVATTKAFTTQLVGLLMLTLVLGQYNGLSATKTTDIIEQLKHLPKLTEQILALDNQIRLLAEKFTDKEHAFFLGRGINYPIALEGALKMKEISYIHAEAYPAGELKHGPLALIDKDMPVIVIVPQDELTEKLKSNLHEISARGGELFIFTEEGANIPDNHGWAIVKLPTLTSDIRPIIYNIPLQLLAYHVAVLKGTDVDRPRNLAKSVTVE